MIYEAKSLKDEVNSGNMSKIEFVKKKSSYIKISGRQYNHDCKIKETKIFCTRKKTNKYNQEQCF